MLTFWEYIKDIWPQVYIIIYWVYITIIGLVVILVITDDKNPVKTLAWVMVLIFLPVAGLVFYIFFGQNYRKQKIFSRKGLQDFRQIEHLRFQQLQYLDRPEITGYRPAFKKMHIMKLLLNNSKSIISRNNTIEVLQNGAEKFPSLIKALKSAKHHIHIEYYIIENDEIGSKILEILKIQARQGVEVRLIFDHVGSWHLSDKKLKALRAAGAHVEKFMPVTFPYFTSKINYRNHRKIVVIDGQTGYVGGMNIADKYIHGTKKLGAWRDTHLKITGDAVHSLQTVFLTDWYFLTNQLPGDEVYFPESLSQSQSIVQIAASGPDSSWAGIMQTYFYAIATARKHIYITTPYLLPNSSILTALKTAALSGVDVKLIVPRKSDSKVIYYASLSYIKELLEAGIKVHFYDKGFIHSKMLVVDGILSSVGTANLDYRSFALNFEVNALIYDEVTAETLTQHFQEDLQNSTLITTTQWAERKIVNKMKSSIARMFSPLL